MKKFIVKYNLINIFRIFFYIFRIFPIKNNKICFINFSGKSYGDNPKYITEELMTRKKKYDVVWFVKDKKNSSFSKNVRLVKIYSLRYFYDLATAKVWVNNSRFPLFVIKRKSQFYIQTWHGGVGLKKVEQSAEDKLSDYYKKAAPHDSKMIDVAISNSKYRTEIYKNHFWYDGKILEFGCPRNDLFYNFDKKKEIDKKIRKMYNISSSKKIIMYAPTFRTNEFDYFSININKLLKKLKKCENNDYVFLVKLHPRFADNKIFNSDDFINVTNYSDTDELLIITNILISDYSSIIFDFILTGNPVYLYSPDYDNYVDERGLNFEYKKLPFSISYSNDELIEKIVNHDYENYKKKLANFIKDLGIIDDGNASKRVVDLIEEKMN